MRRPIGSHRGMLVRQTIQALRWVSPRCLAVSYAAITVVLVASLAIPRAVALAHLFEDRTRVAELREQRRLREDELRDLLLRLSGIEGQLKAEGLDRPLRDEEVARDKLIELLRGSGIIVESVTTSSEKNRDNKEAVFTARGHGSYENILAALSELQSFGGTLVLENFSLSSAVSPFERLGLEIVVGFEEPLVSNAECSADMRLKNVHVDSVW